MNRSLQVDKLVIEKKSHKKAYGTYLMDDDWVGEEYASQNTLVLKIIE